jgi:hypothetical protein
MRQILARLAALALILGIASCGGDGPDYVWFRAMHAIPDGPVVRISYDGYVFRRDLSFGNSTEESGDALLTRAGDRPLMTAQYFEPGNQIGGTLLTREVPLEKDAVSTVILAGDFDAPEVITIVSPRRPRPLGSIYFQFAHATPTLGAIDVYVTETDTDLAATAPIATIEPLAYSGSIEVPFGDTRIRLAPAGTLDVVFDTGELVFPEQTGALGAGAEWLFAVAPSVVPGPSQLQLIGSTGRAAATFRNIDTPATVRAFHASPDVPAVDVVAQTEPESLLFGGLEFGERSPLVAAPVATVDIDFRIAGQPAEIVATRELTFTSGAEYSLFLVEPLETANILAVENQSRGVANEARMRFAHLAQGAEFYSAYVTTSEDEERTTANRIIVDLRYAQVTNYLPRLPGDYFITFTSRFFENQEDAANATETVVYGPVALDLLGGDVLTWAIFPAPAEGEPEVLQKFDDRMP